MFTAMILALFAAVGHANAQTIKITKSNAVSFRIARSTLLPRYTCYFKSAGYVIGTINTSKITAGKTKWIKSKSSKTPPYTLANRLCGAYFQRIKTVVAAPTIAAPKFTETPLVPTQPRSVVSLTPTPTATSTPDPCTVGAVFHVSKKGSDINSGTKDSPFATVLKARDTIRSLPTAIKSSPITVCIGEGDYHLEDSLTFTAIDSGSETAPIVYRKYPNQDAPTFKGSRILPLVSGQSGKITLDVSNLSFVATTGVHQLFFNGVRYDKARFPRKVTPNFDNVDPYLGSFLSTSSTQPNCGTNSATGMEVHVDPSALHTSGWDFSSAEIQIYLSGGVSSITPISSYNASTGVLSLTQHTAWYDVCEHDPFYIQNVPELVTQSGDWSFNKQNKLITFYLPKSTYPTDQLSIPAFLGPVFKVTKAHDLRFEGLKVQESLGDGFFIGESQNIKIKDIESSGIYGQGGGQNGFGAIDGKSGNGITVWSSQNSTVDSCTVSDVSGQGIATVETPEHVKKLQQSGNIISNSEVFNIGTASMESAGIYIGDIGGKALHNYVHDVPKAGISGEFILAEIAYNVVERTSLLAFDMGAIYTYGAGGLTSWGANIHHNIINDTGGYYFADGVRKFRGSTWGIYLDGNASKNNVHHNIIVRAVSACVITEGFYNVFENNICYKPDSGTAAQFDSNRGDIPQVYSNIQSMAANGYDVAAYLAAYPELAIFPSQWNKNLQANGLVFKHNVLWGIRKSGFFTNYLRGINYSKGVTDIDYNLYFDPSGVPVFNDGFFDSQDYNSFGPINFSGVNSWQQHNFDVNGAVSDPQFIDAENGDFRFRSGSLAMRLGIEAVDQSHVGLLNN